MKCTSITREKNAKKQPVLLQPFLIKYFGQRGGGGGGGAIIRRNTVDSFVFGSHHKLGLCFLFVNFFLLPGVFGRSLLRRMLPQNAAALCQLLA